MELRTPAGMPYAAHVGGTEIKARNVYADHAPDPAQVKRDYEQGSELSASHSLIFPDDRDSTTEIDDLVYSDSWSIDDMARGLERDGKMRALEQVLTLPIRTAAHTWSIEPASSSARDRKVAREITELLEALRVPLPETIAQMTGAFVFRRSYHEKVFTTSPDGKVTYAKLAWRPPASCSLVRDKKTGSIQGFKQSVPGQTERVYIQNPYALVYVHGRHRDPIRGISDMEVAYQCYEAKTKLRFLWFNFLEGQVLPRVVVRAKSKDAAGKAVKAIAALKNSGVVGIPTEWVDSVDTLDVSGRGADEFNKAMTWLDSEASTSMLAGFVDLAGAAASGTGSYALSSSQIDFFMQSLTGYKAEIEVTVQQGILADLVRLNYGKDTPVPKFALGPLVPEDVKSQVDMLPSLAGMADSLIPREFVDQLTVKVAAALGLDVDEIQKAVDEATQKAKQEQATAAEGQEPGEEPAEDPTGDTEDPTGDAEDAPGTNEPVAHAVGAARALMDVVNNASA